MSELGMVLLVLQAALIAPIYCSRQSRIIGGDLADAGQFPFSAAIYKSTPDGTFFCGGTLLNQEWILTAGQCVDGATLFTIRLGSNNLNSNDPNGQRLATDSYVLHPDYNPDTVENDLGLIKLRMPITYTTYISPIDFLPTSDLKSYTGAMALGWGQIDDATAGLVDELRWVRLTVLSNEECRLIYGTQITDNMACVDGNYNEGTCKGDSGGPLVETIGNQRGYMMIVGVASFISGNGCESTDPSGYTRVFPYIDWIYNTTGMH
jgi:secreted trypsin-like serine protease